MLAGSGGYATVKVSRVVLCPRAASLAVVELHAVAVRLAAVEAAGRTAIVELCAARAAPGSHLAAALALWQRWRLVK